MLGAMSLRRDTSYPASARRFCASSIDPATWYPTEVPACGPTAVHHDLWWSKPVVR